MCLGSCKAATALSGILRDSAQGRKGLMKRFVSILIYSLCTITAHGQQHDSPAQAIVHVATAVNHLTVLEFHEPVTMAAAGSSDFQIERQDSKVFIKPTKSGVSTDLFVWTASRRFAYELETTQELKNMNFAIDNSLPVPPPVVSTGADELADMMLTRAFLGAVEIRGSRSRSSTNQVSVRIEQVFRTRSTAYIHYTIENDTKDAYRVVSPVAYQLQADHSSISVGSLLHTQLDTHMLKKLGATQALSLPVARAESETQELEAGASTQGVVVIKQDLTSPTVVQVVFNGGLKATFVM
jgi:hypothetical protein